MIIDFHTHIFPDKIAEKTISALASAASTKAYGDGTAKGLTDSATAAGVDICVALPVLTKPSQFDSVNAFALAQNEAFERGEGKILSFAGVHPDCENIEEKLDFILRQGFKGIKIHPEYQNAYFDDDRYIKILALAKERGLITVTHAGVDGAFRDNEVKCSPDRVIRALEILGGYDKLVLAHLGGCEMTEEVYDKLASVPVYFDTAYVLKHIKKEDFTRMLKRKGEDRMLFATDHPWSGQSEDIAIIKSYGLDKETQEKILYKNALKLLCLEEK